MNNNEGMPPGTILESNEEIRRAQEAIRSQKAAKSNPKSTSKTSLFRPSLRAPIAVLTVMDDGCSTGEEIRMRDADFVIGRTDGDLKLSFDELLSSKHLQISRREANGTWHWVVKDLQSKNGVFFRVSKAPVRDQAEFLIGRGCYRLQKAKHEDKNEPKPKEAKVPATLMLEASSVKGIDSLLEISYGKQGSRFNLIKNSYSIGTDQKCDIVRVGDSYTSGLHAELTRSKNGNWAVKNKRSRNGVWVRFDQISVPSGSSCEFQAGEQRFKLKSGNDS